MQRVTIRDVTEACPVAGTAGTPALRDTALALAPRVAPPEAPRSRVVEIAAALILLGVGLDPTDHGLSLDAETEARAALEHEQLLRAGESTEARIARMQHERDAAVEKARVVLEAAADNTRARLEAEDRAAAAERERVVALDELAAVKDRLRSEIGIADRARSELESKLDAAQVRITELEAQLAAPPAEAPAPEAAAETRKRRN